jgi:hypothetical protein
MQQGICLALLVTHNVSTTLIKRKTSIRTNCITGLHQRVPAMPSVNNVKLQLASAKADIRAAVVIYFTEVAILLGCTQGKTL